MMGRVEWRTGSYLYKYSTHMWISQKKLKGKIMTLCTVTEVLHETESAEAYLKLHFQELER